MARRRWEWLEFIFLILLLVVLWYLWQKQQNPTPSPATNLSFGTPDPKRFKVGIDVPDPRKTPGDVLTTDPKVICVSGYTKTVRDVPSSVKQQVYAAYGIAKHKPGDYEVDHLISLQLGGSNSVRNLWPEPYKTKPINAYVKDRIENKLHALVCAGQLDLRTAQAMIAQNWPLAYETYIGPLPDKTGKR